MGPGKGEPEISGSDQILSQSQFAARAERPELRLGAATPPEPSSALKQRDESGSPSKGPVIMHKPVCAD